MRTLKLLISYDGTDFVGWQRQREGATIQGAIEQKLSQIYDEPIRIFGAGRTDAGTHAVGQVAHFQVEGKEDRDAALRRAMNALLPDSIVIKQAWVAPDEFHARRSAQRKTYIYRIWNHPTRSALWRQRALWLPHAIDLQHLNRLAQGTVGRKDFKSFQTQGTVLKTTVRHVDLCQWTQRGPHLLQLSIRANGFLKQMVRNLVGTWLYLERQGLDLTQFFKILEARDRRQAKATAPAHGLYLRHVEYPALLDNKCRKI